MLNRTTLNRTRPHRPGGFTLTELLVAMTLGAVLLTGLLAFFAGLLDMQSRLLRQQRLHQALAGLMTVMVHDIRRAGFWAHAGRTVGTPAGDTLAFLSAADNPFSAALRHDGSCLLYAYDLDGNGRQDRNEQRGFRLQAGILLTRRSGRPRERECATGRWWRLSDPAALQVTRLEFRIHRLDRDTREDQWHGLGVEIVLAGSLRAFPTETATLRSTVYPPNLLLPPDASADTGAAR